MKTLLTLGLAAIAATSPFHFSTGTVSGTWQTPDWPESSIVTEDGNEWIVSDELPEGARVVILFDDMDTETIYDDEIVAVTVLP